MKLQSKENTDYQLVFKQLIILPFFFLLFMMALGKGMAEEKVQMVHYASKDNPDIIFLNGSVFYLENHVSIFGKYAVLYNVENDKLTRVTQFNNYAYIHGIYCEKIVICMAESTYTNLPTHLWYILYDPKSRSQELLPEPINKIITDNEHVLLKGYGETIIINIQNNLYSYTAASNQIVPIIIEPSVDFVNLRSTYCFAKSDQGTFLIYPIDGCIQIAKVLNDLPPERIRIPKTHQIYYFKEVNGVTNIECVEVTDHKILYCDTIPISGIDYIVLSMDSYGEYIYVAAGCTIKRYNIKDRCYDQSFSYDIIIDEYQYVSNILIYENKIVYLIHDKNDDKLILDNLDT